MPLIVPGQESPVGASFHRYLGDDRSRGKLHSLRDKWLSLLFDYDKKRYDTSYIARTIMKVIGMYE
jgi:hypothetical protein